MRRTGTTRAVRDMLALSPCTLEELSQFIGEPKRRISNCLSSIRRAGDVEAFEHVENAKGQKTTRWRATR